MPHHGNLAKLAECAEQLPVGYRHFYMHDYNRGLYKGAHLTFCTEHSRYDCGPDNCANPRAHGADGWNDYCYVVFGMNSQEVRGLVHKMKEQK
jgi:hypothetical protein